MYQNQPCGRLTDQDQGGGKSKYGWEKVCLCLGKVVKWPPTVAKNFVGNGFDAAVYITSYAFRLSS